MSEEQTIIVDPHGRAIERPVRKKAAPPGTCPGCGAGKEKRHAALGGFSYCMKCGHEFEDQ